MADLRAGGALDGVLDRLRVDHVDAVHPAQPGRPRNRAARLGLRLSASLAPRVRGRRVSEYLFALSSVLTPFFMGTVVGAVASGRVPVGNAAGDPSRAGSTRSRCSSVCCSSRPAPTCLRCSSSATRGDSATSSWSAISRCARSPRPWRQERSPLAGVFVLRDDARYVYDRLTDQALPLMILSGACGLGVVAMLARGARRGARALAVGAVAASSGDGESPSSLPAPREATIADGAAPTRPSRRCWSCSGSRSCSCCRRSPCSTC